MYSRSSRLTKSAELRRPIIVVACLIVGFSLGCGGSSDGVGGDAGILQIFIGTWHATADSETVTCLGQSMTDTTVTDTSWEKGTTSDIVQPKDSSGCELLANTSGRTATGLSNQTCTSTMGGETTSLTLTSYTFVVTDDGTRATENGTGTAVVTATGGPPVSCTFTQSASYTKTR